MAIDPRDRKLRATGTERESHSPRWRRENSGGVDISHVICGGGGGGGGGDGFFCDRGPSPIGITEIRFFFFFFFFFFETHVHTHTKKKAVFCD
jgi:hypothetical protein